MDVSGEYAGKLHPISGRVVLQWGVTGSRAELWGLVAEAYDLGEVIEVVEEPARGLQGEVRRLTTSSGRWAVKESHHDIGEAEARRIGDFQELARRAGVPAPRVRTTRDGRHLARFGGRAVRVQGWVDVHDPDPTLDAAAVGETVARLHRVRVPCSGAQPHWWFTEPVGAGGWDELVAAARAAGAPFADRLAGVRDDLVALEQVMTPMEPVQLCHLDLWSDNLRGTPDGTLCVLDWDEAGPADPSRELALVVYEFARHDPARIATLLGAYREAGGPGRLADPADFGLLAAQLGHLGERHLRHWLDRSMDDEARRRALAGIEEFLEDPLTPAMVTAILAAAP